MPNTKTIRWNWLRGMYLYTALGAGSVGLGLLGIPETLADLLNMPVQDPVMRGAVGSCYVAFGLLALMGLRAPLRFLPVLLLQMVYKSVWLLVVFPPLVLQGNPPLYSVLFALIFATYVVGDIMAIPFHMLFPKDDIPK